MRTITRRVSGMALGLALLLRAASAATVPTDKLPFLAVPKMATPPTVDGTIDPAEWRNAAALSGVVEQGGNVLHPRPTTFFLAWDETHLYLACRTWVMPGYKPRVSGRRPHAAGVGDDGLELHWAPGGANVADGRTDSSYKFFVNALGHTGGYNRVAVGQQFMNWLPDFKAATRLTEPGSAPKGGRWWELEFAATVEDFELAGPHRVGDEWTMMLGFNHMPMWMQARIPANSGYFDPAGYGRIRLVENVPAVQLRMESLPGLSDGTAAAEIDAYNPTDTPAKLRVEAYLAELRPAEEKGAPEEEVELIRRDATLDVPPGEGATWSLAEALPRDLGKHRGIVQFRVHAGEAELLRYYAYFKTAYPDKWMAYTPPDEAFPLRATFNPIEYTLFLRGDAYYLPDPDVATALRYRVEDEGGKVVHEGALEEADHYVFSELLPLPTLAPGTYTVTASLVRKDGGEIGPETVAIEKLDEAKVFAEWWQNDLGNVERVLPPFEPVTREGDAVGVFGRTYRLGGLGLPRSIVSRGEEVLAAPVRIVVVRNGREEVVDLETNATITEATDWRVRFEGTAEGAGLRFVAKGWIEQDGLWYADLTYAPAGKGGEVVLDGLRLEYPLRADVAEGMLCIGPGGNYSARTIKRLEAKQGSLWSTLEIGRLGSGMTVGSFFPEVWLGSERRGLLWWGDNDKGWVPEDEVPAHEIVRRGEEVVLVNHVIGSAYTLAEPRTLSFSLNATPFRPLVENWRRVTHSTNGTFTGGPDWGGIGYKMRRDPETGNVVDGWDWIAPPSTDPEEWSAIWAQYKEKADAKVHREKPFDPSKARNWMFVHTSLASVGYGWKSPDKRVTGYLSPVWGRKENYCRSNIDYYVYLFDRAIREGGLRTVYWDIFFPHAHTTLQNGIAYELPDGRAQPGYAGWNRRRFHMRVHALFLDHGLVPGAQVCHATNAYQLVAMPWVSALLDGEYHKLTNESTMDWVDGYSVERMQFMSCAHTWGVGVSWMNHIHIKDKEKKKRVQRGQKDYCRMFDSWAGANLGKPGDAMVDWGLLDAEFVPFWRNDLVTSEDPEVLVSLWRLPDRIILGVFNNNGQKTKSPTLAIDLDGLNLEPTLEWQEWIGLRDLDRYEEGNFARTTILDYYERTLTVRGVKPHTARWIGVRRY